MDLSKLRKPDLVMLCEEMGIEVATLRRKPLLIQALEDSGADEEELSECWELIQERMKRESEDKERETVRRKEEAEIQIREIERLRLQLQIVEAKCASSVREENAEIQADARLSMRDLLQPYKMSEDIALFLVNFERTCARVGFDRATWPQKLLTVLPCEAADTLARLPETDADDYNKIKAALLKKFRLSAEAFRRRFRDAQKTTSETFQEFAFNMKADLVEWLKGEGVYEDRDKVVDLICLEQFYGSIDEEMRLWIQDRPGERNIERAAELADEYTVRRQSEKARVRPFSKQPLKDRPERKGPFTVKNATENEAKENSEKEKNFESKKPLLCFRCQEPGHIAAGCRKPKLVFSVTGSDDENMQLLRPYVRDLVVNGKDCKVLRDSGATMDIVHPDYVEATHFTGECAWIRQVAQKNSICLPIAKVTIEGPFGVLETEAAVSPNLPKQYPYLFSNKSDRLLKNRGLSFGEFVVQAITRSKTRELAAERADEGEQPRAVDPCEQASTSAGEDGSRYVAPVILGDSSATDAPIRLSAEEPACDTVEKVFPYIALPHSESLLHLLNVDEDTLMQKAPIEDTQVKYCHPARLYPVIILMAYPATPHQAYNLVSPLWATLLVRQVHLPNSDCQINRSHRACLVNLACRAKPPKAVDLVHRASLVYKAPWPTLSNQAWPIRQSTPPPVTSRTTVSNSATRCHPQEHSITTQISFLNAVVGMKLHSNKPYKGMKLL
ncbi:hypothetical protein HPB50_003893 [Hyalomma asiaticum]|uniref:Uncharacterized protein n=1 Tax=Hyalomma asiaticum TaxID=266040 RepID=A0ACB7RQY6_HYAAI|nr:hypothetical protein HPB50_003893 [Hyalomma asiaticum]